LKRRSFLQSLAALAAALGAPASRAATSRIALVVGNNTYPQSPLVNAANDARLMAGVLGEGGFAVQSRIDASNAALLEAVRDFGAAAAQPGVELALFYYAGHGAQVEWHNFLLPVDVKIDSAVDLKAKTFDLAALLAALPKAGDRTFVVILDACRDNPFGASFHPDRPGLSQFDAPLSTLIAFSTSPGSLASDGAGANGLYTENLARELKVPGLRIEDVFKRVRANVSTASRGLQVPWESTSLTRDVYILPPRAPLTEEEQEKLFEQEVAYWTRIKGSKNPADWAGLLRSFPNGKLCEIAQARLNLLLAQARPAASRGLRSHGPIELGPGLPVPERLRREANPFSAGTYALERHFNVGDEARYRLLEEDTKGDRRVHRRVTAVDADAERVEFNDGKFVTDLFGNLVKRDLEEFTVPVQVAPAELQVGKRWSAVFFTRRRGGGFDDQMDAAIVAREAIRVPAGEFDAFRIEAVIHGRASDALFHKGRGKKAKERRAELTLWEVPGLNFPVKERQVLNRRSGEVDISSYELQSLRQKE
jgi:caspase domain-containing protein